MVTPHAPAAGYVSPEIKSVTLSGPGTGTAAINILDPDSIKSFHTYRLEYQNTSVYQNDGHPYYRLIDYTAKDTLIKSTRFISNNVQTLTTDGFSLSVTNDS
jgi:hypothetical protein